MARKLIKMIKINGLQYNAQRDPAIYRRPVNQPFRIQALPGGSQATHCVLRDEKGKILAEATLAPPGTFTHELSFPTPGTRIVTLSAESGAQEFAQDLRLDVLEHAWVG